MSPNNGLATTSTANVVINGTDLAFNAAITVAGTAVPTASCSYTNTPTTITCTVPAATGMMAARGNVVLTNTADRGGGTATLANGWTYTGVLNESDAANEADFCRLNTGTVVAKQGQSTPPVEMQIFEAGLTNTTTGGPAAGILAEVGFGPTATSPTANTTWRFFSAPTFVGEGGTNNNDDLYTGTFPVPAAGAYSLVSRVSLDGGINWTYCDTDGAGSNAGLTFETANLGTLTATP